MDEIAGVRWVAIRSASEYGGRITRPGLFAALPAIFEGRSCELCETPGADGASAGILLVEDFVVERWGWTPSYIVLRGSW